MENQEQIINQLKAEVYDVSKQLQQTTALLGQIAKLVEAETVEEMLSKITEAFAPKGVATKSSASIPAPESQIEQPKIEPSPVKPKPAKSAARQSKLVIDSM
jgi:hypothetical protein